MLWFDRVIDLLRGKLTDREQRTVDAGAELAVKAEQTVAASVPVKEHSQQLVEAATMAARALRGFNR